MIHDRYASLPETLYNAEQVRALDDIAINDVGIAGLELMKRAARAAFHALLNQWPNVSSIQVFCGSGNNAGDGYLVALMAAEKGLKTEVIYLSDPEQLSGDALEAYKACCQAGVTLSAWHGVMTIDADVVVDAILGTGLTRVVSGRYQQAIEQINASGQPVLAVDIPSGLCADTGVPKGCAIRAALTITFIGVKQGLLTAQGPEWCGQLRFSDLDVPDDVYQRVPPSCCRLSAGRLSHLMPRRAKDAHKGDHGHVLIVGGNHGMPGAVIMAAEAALYSGAGKVTVATRKEHLTALAVRKPEVMASAVGDGSELVPMLADKNAIVVGPGLGQDEWAEGLLSTVLRADCPVVLDADALNLLAIHPEWLPDIRCPVILTPHPGEAGRLLGKSASVVNQNRFLSLKEIAARYNVTVVLKGAGSLIFDGEQTSLCSAGNPGMAVAGMGDVLSGVIGALLAQHLTARDASQLGVWLHASAADELVAEQGEIGLQATEIMYSVRRQIKRLSDCYLKNMS